MKGLVECVGEVLCPRNAEQERSSFIKLYAHGPQRFGNPGAVA